MRKIAFSCLRGSSEKTEACVAFGAALAARGAKTLIVDADVQGRIAASLGLQPRLGLADLLDRTAALEDVIVQARQHLWMIFGGPRLADADRILAKRRLPASAALIQALEGIHGYDYVLLDTPPLENAVQVGCLYFADELVVPVDRQVLSSAELPDFNRAIERVRLCRPEMPIRCIVPQMEAKYGRTLGPARKPGFYQLTTLGAAGAVDLVAKRRPANGAARPRRTAVRSERGGGIALPSRGSWASRARAWRPLSRLD